jgi:hypothetical protein
LTFVGKRKRSKAQAKTHGNPASTMKAKSHGQRRKKFQQPAQGKAPPV